MEGQGLRLVAGAGGGLGGVDEEHAGPGAVGGRRQVEGQGGVLGAHLGHLHQHAGGLGQHPEPLRGGGIGPGQRRLGLGLHLGGGLEAQRRVVAEAPVDLGEVGGAQDLAAQLRGTRPRGRRCRRGRSGGCRWGRAPARCSGARPGGSPLRRREASRCPTSPGDGRRGARRRRWRRGSGRGRGGRPPPPGACMARRHSATSAFGHVGRRHDGQEGVLLDRGGQVGVELGEHLLDGHPGRGAPGGHALEEAVDGVVERGAHAGGLHHVGGGVFGGDRGHLGDVGDQVHVRAEHRVDQELGVARSAASRPGCSPRTGEPRG